MTEQPDGIEEAEAAALALEQAIGAPPSVASPAYLDEVGAATRALERALGDHASPFATRSPRRPGRSRHSSPRSRRGHVAARSR